MFLSSCCDDAEMLGACWQWVVLAWLSSEANGKTGVVLVGETISSGDGQHGGD